MKIEPAASACGTEQNEPTPNESRWVRFVIGKQACLCLANQNLIRMKHIIFAG